MVGVLDKTMALSFVYLISLGMCVSCVSGNLVKYLHAPKTDRLLNFLVLGDWGRKGEYNQSKVAFQMGRIGEKLDIDFVVKTGDNFYDNGLTGVRDDAFDESFTRIYTAESLQTQWYSVLGNHDYRGNAESQLSHVLRERESRWLCLRSFLVDTELAEIFFVDTTPFVKEYFTNPEEHTYDWRGIPSRNIYINRLLKDLELALMESTAKWKIVVGHHAIRSEGHHGDTEELIQDLLPILRAYDVDFYMNGHDHCLQQISDTKSPLQFFTSGAGSKAWRGDTRNLNSDDLQFYNDGQGFMSVQLTPTDAKIEFYDVYGGILNTWNSVKQLHPSI